MMWLLDTTVRMSLVLGIGLGAALALRHGSAALRHWVIAAAIFCSATVPVLGLVVPAWTLPHKPIGAREPVAQIAPAASGVASGLTPRASEQPARTTSPWSNRFRDLLVPIWVAGAAINLLILLVALFRLSRLASRAAVVRAGVWRSGLTAVARTLGVNRPVVLLRSDRPALLVTWGLASPTVLLPADAGDWPDERIRVVLAHELAHVARGDWFIQIGAELLRCVYWFNPLLWFACTRLRHESEHACDDAVMNAGVESDVYATHLLELARAFSRYRRTWFPAPAMAGRPSILERRISAMLNRRLNRHPLTRAGRWCSALALLAITLPIAAFAQDSFGSVYGVVVDPMDRVLPATTITVSDGQRNIKHEVRTDRDGRFELVGLPPGTYSMETKLPGFMTREDTFAVGGGAVERNLKLEIGTLQETITVIGKPGTPGDERRAPIVAARRAIPACPAPSPVGGNIRPPRKVRDVRPVYPGVDGHVALVARIGTDGSVAEVIVVKSDRPELEGPAIAAVSQWQFDETLLNCVPVEVRMTVDVNFRPE
jgi:beta-lactamase regulating signal transducer with metallopeptidase domain